MQRKKFVDLTLPELEENIKKIYSGEVTDSTPLTPGSWGKAGMYHINNDYPIWKFISVIKCKSILDFGCGQANTVDNLQAQFPDVEFTRYDPYVDEYKTYPTGTYDLILCNLVLQLLDRATVKETIKEIHSLANNYVFVSVKIHEDNDFDKKLLEWNRKLDSLFNIVSQDVLAMPAQAATAGHKQALTFVLKKK